MRESKSAHQMRRLACQLAPQKLCSQTRSGKKFLKVAWNRETSSDIVNVDRVLCVLAEKHGAPLPFRSCDGSTNRPGLIQCARLGCCCQFNHACAVLSPASLQILFRRNHALNNASASGDSTTVTSSLIVSKEKSSRREKTARGLGGLSLVLRPGGCEGWRGIR